MQLSRSLIKKVKSHPGLRILLWATLMAVLCGVSGFSEPLDTILRAARGKFIDHQPSGEVVIVEVDNKDITGGDSDLKSKLYHARLITKLSAMGAKRIIIHMEASRYSGSPGDRALLAALQKSDTIFNVVPTDNISTQGSNIEPPARQFLKFATISVDKLNSDNAFGFVDNVSNSVKINGHTYLSTANKIGESVDESRSNLTLDINIDSKKIARIDEKNIETSILGFNDKYVVLDYISNGNAKQYSAVNNKNISMPSIIALSIETAMRGRNISVYWVPAIIVLFIYCLLITFSVRIFVTKQAQLLMMSLTLAVPVWLDDKLIFSETAPALMLLGWVIAGRSWMAFNLTRSRINPGTGFANLNALRDLELPLTSCLVVARVQNFAEICAILPSEKHDDLAVQIVQRLSLSADGATIYQGDDGVFAWVMYDARETPVHDTLEGLHALFSSAVQIEAHRLDLSLTFGIDKTKGRSVSNRFGSALVAAKEAAEAHVRWKEYDAAALDTAEWKLSLVGELEEAIDKGQIWVAYQPKIDIVSGAINGAEALVRWSHPIRGEVGPVDFVMAAEAQNRIGKLTNFVLDQALGIASTVRQTNPDFTMAVNLSGRLLDAPHMFATITELLRQHNYPAEKLTLEITESAAIESNQATKVFLTALRQLGIKISIDDYGTGFSTLDYVTSIPASEIKIDRRFVSQMQTSQSDRVVVNSTIQLAHQLGRLAVAEGVEDAETLASLGSMGCDVAQGYFISKPLTHQSLFSLLAQQTKTEDRLAG